MAASFLHFQRHFLDWISIKISLQFVPKRSINNSPTLAQIMAWRRPGDKPLSEPMMIRLSTHICVTRPQCVNAIWHFSKQNEMETILPFDFCAAEMRPTIGYVNNKNHWIILIIKIIKIDGVMTNLSLTCTEDPLPSSLDLWTFTSCEECICSHIFTPGGVLKVPHLVLEIFAFEHVADTLISYMCEACSILTLFHTPLPSK